MKQDKTRSVKVKSLLLLAMLVAMGYQATSQTYFVITDGAAVNRRSATVGEHFLALNPGVTPSVVYTDVFSERCVWTRTGTIGYYFQEVDGYRYYLINSTSNGGTALGLERVHVDSMIHQPTTWYDWTFGLATQQVFNSEKSYYWIVVNGAGNGWELSCDTYGRPGTGHGDEKTANCATSATAATFNLVRIEPHPIVVEQSEGGLNGATLNVSTEIAQNATITATIEGMTTYKSASTTAYDLYKLYNVTGIASNTGENDEGHYSFDGQWYYPIAVAESHYFYGEAMHDNPPTAGTALEERTLVNEKCYWTVEGSGKRYISHTYQTSAPLTATLVAGDWNTSGLKVKLSFTAVYSDGSQQTISEEISLSNDPTAIEAASPTATVVRGEQLVLPYTLTPIDAHDDVRPSGTLADNTLHAAGDYPMTLTAYKTDGAVACSTTVAVALLPKAPVAIDFGNTNDGRPYLSSIALAEGESSYGGTVKYKIGESGTATVWTGDTLHLKVGDVVTAWVEENGKSSATTTARATLTTGLTADSSVVILNDFEDHNWSYYSDPECPIRSLYPRNFQIIYDGYGRVSKNKNNTEYEDVPSTMPVGVGIDARKTSKFVYLKTLERYDTTSESSRFEYRTIFNPFSVRPTYGTISTSSGSNCWRGFGKWRVRKIMGNGSIYTAATGGTEITEGSTIEADALIYFAPTNSSRSNADNATEMTLELEAVWDYAWLMTTLNVPTTAQLGGATEELNFVVLINNSGIKHNATTNKNKIPLTIMSIYPNGTSSGTGNIATGRSNTSKITSIGYTSENVKFEYINLNGTNIIGRPYSRIRIGRGVMSMSSSSINITTSDNNPDDISGILQLETGNYTTAVLFRATNTSISNGPYRWIIGNDYDRAITNYDSLIIYGETKFVSINQSVGYNSSNKNKYLFDLTFKSGTHNTPNSSGKDIHKERIYLGGFWEDNYYVGKRKLTVEGGNIRAIAGGKMSTSSTYIPSDGYGVEIRIKGGEIQEMIYGGAEYATSQAGNKIICTGGAIKGWICGGCNASHTDGAGDLKGSSMLYLGGTAKLLNTSNTYNGALSGNIFGAGVGTGSNSTTATGKVSNSLVVVADEAEIAGNVYGGGNLGWATESSKVYVLGGTVQGKVFGGGNQNKGTHGEASITMTGGTVLGGVYGGSSGNMGSSDAKYKTSGATVRISGGTVGSNESDSSVFGCGWGADTRVEGDVKVIFDRSTESRRAEVWGSVYGGGQKAPYTQTGHEFKVDIHGGEIHKNVYGGGQSATVKGNTDVFVGGNALIDGSVFGGGDYKDVDGNTKVTLGSCTVLKNVYGGGNEGPVTGKTEVIIGSDSTTDY